MLNKVELGFTPRPIAGNCIETTSEAKQHYTGKAQNSHNFCAELLIEIGSMGVWFFFRLVKRIYRELQKRELSVTMHTSILLSSGS